MSCSTLDVLVCGGTGSQARPTVMHLLRRGHTPYVLTRNPKNAAELESAGAHVVVGNLGDSECLRDACGKVDAIAFLLPAFLNTQEEGKLYGRNVVDAAVANGVNSFVWNVSGPMPDDDASPDTKPAIFRYLQDSALGWLLLEPTTYMENWLGPWTAPSVRQKNILTYPVLHGTRVGWIASDDVGALVVAALERPELAGSRFRVSGIESPDGAELAAIFSSALERKIRYQTLAPEAMGAILDQEYGPGSGDRIAKMYRKEQNDPNPEPKFHDMGPVLGTLPVNMTTIADWVKRHAEAFV